MNDVHLIITRGVFITFESELSLVMAALFFMMI